MPTVAVGNTIIPKLEEDWNDHDMRIINLNAVATNMLEYALSPRDYNWISACEIAKEIWDKLKVTHEVT